MRVQNKLPIPRLQRERRDSGGRRTSRACNPCRGRKTKCDGGKPICSQCRGLGVTGCFYPDSLVNRLREELKSVRDENENYVELLRDLKNELEEPIAGRISKVINSQRPISTRQQRRPSNASSSSSLGSLEEIDTVYEDINRSEMSRATGYLGKNSEVTWMQRLNLEAAKEEDGDGHQLGILSAFFAGHAPDAIVFEHDDLQEVQVEAQIALFFLIISQVNRSWKMIGIAARSGIALGINLRKKNVAFDATSGEARTKLWWAVVRLEHLLSVMTGRVSCLGDASSSAPPPNPSLSYSDSYVHQPITTPRFQIENLRWTIYLDEEQLQLQKDLLRSITPSPSLYFFYMIDLSMMTHAITNRVYATDVSRAGWGRIESRINLYSEKMEKWAKSLHSTFKFQGAEPSEQLECKSSFQISLALNYYSARITLYRPCLNRPAFDQESGTRLARSRFSNVSALACLRASLAVIMLLPDEPDLTWCYEVVQWWELLHIPSQATVILLLDISIGPAPSRPGEAAVRRESTEHVLNCAKKGVAWLHCMGVTSEAAQRAFKFCNSCIRRIAATKHLDLNGIPSPASSHRTSKPTPDANQIDAQYEFQPESYTECPRLAYHPLVHDGEQCNSMLSPGLQEGFSPMNDLRTSLAVHNSDHDMAELFPHRDNTDADIEELLLSWMAPTD